MDVILPFLIVCPLTLLAGFVDAIAGGGGIVSLPAYFMAGLPAHVAIATNRMSSCMGVSLATYRFARQGIVDWKTAAPCAVLAIAGSALGARLMLAVDDEALRWVMLIALPLTAAYIMRPKSMQPRDRNMSSRQALVLAAALAFLIGAYDGFYGPGSGTFLMLAFISLVGLGINEANGTTKAVNLAANMCGLVVFLAHGQVYLLLGFAGGAFNMLGTWLGVNVFNGRGIKVVKPIMVGVLAVFFLKTLVELVL